MEHYLVFGQSVLNEVLFLVFDVLLFDVWISDETLFIVFDMLLLVFWYQMKHSS